MEALKKKRSVFSVGGLFSVDVDTHKNDKAIKLAIFNSLAILLVFVVSVAACSVYLIFQPFIKPLLWALLCGSALHPIKILLARNLKTVVMALECPSKELCCNVIFSPVLIFIKLADFVGHFVISNLDIIVKCIIVTFSLIVAYVYTPHSVINSFWAFMRANNVLLLYILNLFSSFVVVSGVLVGYICSLLFLWSPENKGAFLILSALMWVVLTAFVSNLIPALRIPLFVLCQLSILLIYLYSSM